MKTKLCKLLFTLVLTAIIIPGIYGQDSSEIKAPAIVKDKDDFHVYLLAGGSNMLGITEFQKKNPAHDSRVFVLNSKNEWVSVEDIFKSPESNTDAVNSGPGIAFGKAISDSNKGAIIGIINCASPDSSIKAWGKGQELHQKALERTRMAMKAGTLKGVIWHQGEADALSMDLKTYTESITTMIEDLREELAPLQKIHPLPFIGGKLASFQFEKERDQFCEFNANLEKIFVEIQRKGLIETKGLKTKGNSVIFDNDSLIEIGRRYAAAMAYLQGEGKLGKAPKHTGKLDFK